MGLALTLTLQLSLAATAPGGLHLVDATGPFAQLTPPPVVSFDDGGDVRSPLPVGATLTDLTLRVRALTERIRRLGPNWPLAPTAVVCLGLFGLVEGLALLPALLLSGSALLPMIYFTVVIGVLALGGFWGYASWVGTAEQRAALIEERDALQRQLDDLTSPPAPAPVPSVLTWPAAPARLVLARF